MDIVTTKASTVCDANVLTLFMPLLRLQIVITSHIGMSLVKSAQFNSHRDLSSSLERMDANLSLTFIILNQSVTNLMRTTVPPLKVTVSFDALNAAKF